MKVGHPDWSLVPAVNYGKGRPVPPSAGVDHYTAAGSGDAVALWVAGKARYRGKKVAAAKVCGHLVLCRDGRVIQQVPIADRAYHAGTRTGRGDLWKGAEPYRNVNDFTVGLEHSNYGWLMKVGSIFRVPRFDRSTKEWIAGKRYPKNLPEPLQARDHNGEVRWWEPYSDEIVEANVGVKRILLDMGLVTERENWVGHSDVSPLRKSDPGPLWPMEYTLDQVFGGSAKVEPHVVQGGEDPPASPADILMMEETQDPDLVGHYDEDAEMCLVEEEPE